jgi:hypothetical protein
MYAEPQEKSNDNASIFDGGELPRAGEKSRFVARFEDELHRLNDAGHALSAWEEENLLGAIGAARLGEHDLACGMIEAAKQPPSASPTREREFRREPMPLATLRRRFERVR